MQKLDNSKYLSTNKLDGGGIFGRGDSDLDFLTKKTWLEVWLWGLHKLKLELFVYQKSYDADFLPKAW